MPPKIFVANVARRSQVEALADKAVQETGGMDVWVNVAGVLVSRPIIELVEDDIDRPLAVNLKGAYWGGGDRQCRPVLRFGREQLWHRIAAAGR
ncbi:MAG: SDR family NAD(P)-dependent oxidoreductase [Novosphingobium sp.]